MIEAVDLIGMAQLGFLEPRDWTLADDERGTIVYRPRVFSNEESPALFGQLLEQVQWSEDSVRMYDRTLAVPRLRKSYNDVAAAPQALRIIHERVSNIEAATFNRMGLNLSIATTTTASPGTAIMKRR